MTNWNSRTTSTLEVDGIEVELEYEPYAGTDVEFKREGDKLVIAYRTHDSDCGNPLTNQDGNGMIHWHPSSKYGRTCGKDYLSLLNIDQYGTKQIDEDKLQEAWQGRVMALPIHLFESEWNGYETTLREQLANVSMNADYSVWTQCFEAWEQHGFDDEWVRATSQVIRKALAWGYDAEIDKCWKGPQKGVVMLDCYEHSGISLSVSGNQEV